MITYFYLYITEFLDGVQGGYLANTIFGKKHVYKTMVDTHRIDELENVKKIHIQNFHCWGCRATALVIY